MPKGVKPTWLKGNGNSGRKTDAEILRHYINMDLANKICNKELKRIDDKGTAELAEMKVIVIPIATKGITEKTENTIILPKPILDITDVLSNDSDQENNTDEEKDTGDTGGNISE